MRKIRLLTSGLVITLFLAGCGEETHSIEWYKEHDVERQTMYDKCIKEPNPRGTENCRNAIDANVHSGNITSSKVKIGNPNITLLFLYHGALYYGTIKHNHFKIIISVKSF